MAGFTAKFGDSPGPSLSLPDQIKENCQEEGYDMVSVHVLFQHEHFFVSRCTLQILQYSQVLNWTIMTKSVAFIVNLAEN